MNIINKFYHEWRDLMDNKSDQRTTNWMLMSSPIPTVIICLSYVYIVKVLGPRFMQDRKPFKLRKIIIVYNFLQVLFSLYLFLEVASVGWIGGGYSWRCQPVNHSTDADTMRMVSVCWWYYFSKFTEFFDTFFFVLRKRYDQVSTLHVIHHGIMPFSVWWGVKFMPGGHSSFFGFLNTFVHIVMYTYYMLAAMGPEMQKYLWWKKYLTMFQMIQFIGIFTHAFQLFFHNPCNYPIVLAYWIGGHGVLFLFLFANFYKQAYTKKEVKVKVDRDINENALNGGNGLYEAKQKAATAFDQNGNHAYSNGVRNRITAVAE
ncbi:hypothetical protein PVAND_005145 [Polypedilum vanderplanki]|uniref:Elongation of very long chain fatty acids protein n=1 Tax=Polypedilum vanderplanki TaxID=319348 RepID=A0A9J6C058_POLVA|nr:hypothetical protein PVAND_005145 [Polypedilum vanderplanki]